jgi:hypothetical protein
MILSDKPRVLTTDEILAAMERDEAEGAAKLSPREYALLRGMKPQLVYYYIRKRKLTLEQCICGRNVIDVALADQFFKLSKETDDAPDGTEV